jgi:guanylate kinase
VIETRMANARVEVAQARHFDFVIINAVVRDGAVRPRRPSCIRSGCKYAAQRRSSAAQVFTALDTDLETTFGGTPWPASPSKTA